MNPETAVLGAAIIDAACVPIVCGELTVEDFTTISNIEVFSAIQDLFKAGRAVDLVTIVAELESRNALETTGGTTYIAEIATEVPTSANVRYYIELMQEERQRRMFVHGMTKALSSAENGDDDFLDIARATVDSASAVGSSGTPKIGDFLPEVIYNLGDTTKGKLTGFKNIDALTGGFREGHLVVIAARPGIGKTALACNIAANMCRAGKSVVYYSIEMSAQEITERVNLSEAMISKYAAKRQEDGAFDAIMAAQSKISGWKMVIDDRGSISAGNIVASAYKVKQSVGKIDCMFVDYLQLIRRPNRKNGTLSQEVGEISRALKILSKEIKCPVVALSQLNRQSVNRRPTIADLRDSGAIEQDADLILLLHRDDENEKNRETTLIVGKNRHGQTGDLSLVWHPEYTRFTEEAFRDVQMSLGVFDEEG